MRVCASEPNGETKSIDPDLISRPLRSSKAPSPTRGRLQGSEFARVLTKNGAEVIAWPVWGCNPLLAQARACENHVFVVSSTFMNHTDGWMHSAVYDQGGRPLARGEKWGH